VNSTEWVFQGMEYVCQVINGRDTLPGWDCLWSDFTQEELRLNLVNGISSNNDKTSKVEKEQENVALAGKGKAVKGSSKGSGQKGDKKKELSKIKCFGCS